MSPRLVVVALSSFGFLVTPEQGAPAPQSCPEGFVARPSRARELAARLGADDEARPLVGSVAFTVCFGSIAEPGVTPSGALLLSDDMPDDRAAARVAHLLHHQLPDSPFFAGPTGECEAWLARVRVEEDAAQDLEARMLARAGLSAEPSPDSNRLAEAYAASFCAGGARPGSLQGSN